MNKKLSLLVFLVVSIALPLTGLADKKPKTSSLSDRVTNNKGLITTLSANKSEMKFGDVVELSLKLENTTDEDIVMYLPAKFNTNTDKNGIEDGSYFQVTNGNGKVIPHVKLSYGGFGVGTILDKFANIPKQSSKFFKITLNSVKKEEPKKRDFFPMTTFSVEGNKASGNKYLAFYRYQRTTIDIHALPFEDDSAIQIQLKYSNHVKEKDGFSDVPDGRKKVKIKDNRLDEGAKRVLEFWENKSKKFQNLWTGTLTSNSVKIKLLGATKN